jgi:two-component system response regulator NreC
MSEPERPRSGSQPQDCGAACERPIGVVLADSDSTSCRGLRALLEGEDDLLVLAEARLLAEVASRLERAKPHVLVVDLGVLGVGRVKALRELYSLHPAVQIVALADDDDPVAAGRVLDGSVAGYVLKDRADGDLAVAVRRAARGEQYVSASVGERLAALHSSATDGVLSAREAEILRLIAFGHTSAEIARRLCLSPRTIETHRARIHSKLELGTRSELVSYALTQGLLSV